MKRLLRNFIDHADDESGKWFNNCVDSDLDKALDIHLESAESLFNIFINLEIMSEYNDGIETMVGDSLVRMVPEIEKNQGFDCKDVGRALDREDHKEALKLTWLFLKNNTYYLWSNKHRIYFIYSATKITCNIFISKAMIKIINPLVWYRFWTGFVKLHIT